MCGWLVLTLVRRFLLHKFLILLMVNATFMASDVLARRAFGDDLALWIDKRQLREFHSPLQMDIFVISDGQVEALIQEPTFERYLPAIPDHVNTVNLSWRAGDKKSYTYEFLKLESTNSGVLKTPKLSIPPRGRVPKKTKVFQISLECVANISGTAVLNVAFSLSPEGNGPIQGMPIRFRLRKQCVSNVPEPECEEKCKNGRCDSRQVCHCPVDYMGRFCEIPFCHPPCQHGGTCVAPGECDCPIGYQGPQCEGGICADRCLNGGKCIQKDVCQCGRGYYGPRCQFSKCSIPCLNGGRCDGVNSCTCRKHFRGKQCETEIPGLRKRNNKRKRKPEVYV
ncbi:protein shifted-like isoform X1 [Varroa jacobsoni]|uniref:protein shifted-like isoform X1 n=2 Tax=Varroa jacobsoni TaxID=62625 RepID=UPI000BF9E59B|nr:protein shifted-like isoform X1 [Varroa jacobsoni]